MLITNPIEVPQPLEAIEERDEGVGPGRGHIRDSRCDAERMTARPIARTGIQAAVVRRLASAGS